LSVGKTNEVEVQSDGADQRAAISAGLEQAIDQTNGITLSQKSVIQSKLTDQVTELKDSFEHKTVTNEEIQTASHGLIDSYSILERTVDPQTKLVHLRMKVVVQVFDPAATYLRHPTVFDPSLVAVVVSDTQNNFDAVLSRGLSKRLTAAGARPEPDFFTTAFATDGLFDKVFEKASWEEVSVLQLPRRAAFVVLVRKSDHLENLAKQGFSDPGSLDVRVLRTADGQTLDSFEVSAKAHGFTEEAAKKRLDENLVQQLEKNDFGDWLAEAAKVRPPGEK
jgi:hypothetical protein